MYVVGERAILLNKAYENGLSQTKVLSAEGIGRLLS